MKSITQVRFPNANDYLQMNEKFFICCWPDGDVDGLVVHQTVQWYANVAVTFKE